MALNIKSIVCELSCDVCGMKIPVDHKLVKLELAKGKVVGSIADALFRLYPYLGGDSNCEVVWMNCNDSLILCQKCADIYNERKELVWSGYCDKAKPENLIKFVKEQI